MVRIEHENPEELKKNIKEIFGRHLDLSHYKIFFFGSRVTGRGDDRSDIDIGILGNEPVPRDAIGKIQDDIEESDILYDIDVVDFATVSDRFKKVAMETTEYLK
ncbi:MAG: nucleotidyltransferase domain-containing protein [Candidatus Liptonbacteria bacterium]|nr:nucleotidyltransferase domain-containing protein [Candidatus Liptonbacteria bacterium]